MRPLRYGSVCSGVEAASLAWEPLGMEPSWFCEIEKFPAAVLAARWPDVPNLGDMTEAHKHERFSTVDVLVGGTPCQSFSVAGLRKGMDDPRGNLALAYLAMARHCRARWVCWENVPGVLSSNGGRDFGAFLGALGKLGYGFAYRVLDAQYFGVPQRRRRVFVVGYLGDWRRAAAVLFEPASMSKHPAPSREARLQVARPLAAGSGSGHRIDLESGALYYTHDRNQDRIYGADGPAPAHCATDSNRARNVLTTDGVRRLSPTECERLQGMPDNHTRIPWRSKPASECPDVPRYKAVGNSMAVPVMAWIGKRLLAVHQQAPEPAQ